MSHPPSSRIRRIAASTLLVGVFFIAPVAAQRPEPGVSPTVSAVGAIVVTLVVGGGLITFAPEFTDRTTQQVHDRPVDALLYGIGIGVATVIALAVLAVTIVGIIPAIPLAVLAIVLSEIGYLAAGRVVTDNWIGVLVVAMGVSAVVGGIPIVGGVLGFVLSSFGLGSTFLYYRED